MPNDINEKKRYHDFYSKSFKDICQGTLIGLGARFVTWPLEYAYYAASMHSGKKPYPQIYKSIIQPKQLYILSCHFVRTGFVQTITRSFANGGILAHVDRNYPNLYPFQKGLFSAVLCAPLETLLTSRDEYRKVQVFLKMQNPTVASSVSNGFFITDFKRVLAASFIRSMWSSVVTFGGIYQTIELFKPFFPYQAETPLFKATAAASFAVFAQPMIMPIINFHTAVLSQPNKPLSQTTLSLFGKNARRKLFSGCLGRSICQGSRYGITFLGLSYFNSATDQDCKQVSKKPS